MRRPLGGRRDRLDARSTTPRRRPERVRTLALALTAVADAAPTHGEEGEMTITKAEATSATTVRVEVGLVYANDNELATGAAVNAQLTGPGGAQVGPVPLSRLDEDSSVYGADVTVPQAGAWQVAVTSTG